MSKPLEEAYEELQLAGRMAGLRAIASQDKDTLELILLIDSDGYMGTIKALREGGYFWMQGGNGGVCTSPKVALESVFNLLVIGDARRRLGGIG